MEFNIATIRGDGIGPEIIDAAILVLNKIGLKYGHKFIYQDVIAGGASIDKYGEPLTDEAVKICKQSDSVLLAAVGGWQWDTLPGNKRPERALLGLRSALELYANLRPAVLHPALMNACPLRKDIAQRGIDIMVVRELTGGMYFGDRGRKTTDMGEAAWDTEMYSHEEARRISVVAFDLARSRRKRLTNVDKANVLESSRLWRSVVLEVAADYPDVVLDHMYVDNASMQLIRDPSHFDVLLSTNMFGDILSDEASQITGSIGMLPSASLGKTKLGMYEPIHGSAPDIAGKDTANPIAMVLSAAMMCRLSLGLDKEAADIENAVTVVLNMGYRTPDIYSDKTERVGTKRMSELILERISADM